MDEREHLYAATIDRLETQILGLEKNRRALKWYLFGSIALALPAASLHWIAALGVLLAGASLYVVGHYIATVHIAEDKSAIADAREVLGALRQEPALPESPTTGASEAPPRV